MTKERKQEAIKLHLLEKQIKEMNNCTFTPFNNNKNKSKDEKNDVNGYLDSSQYKKYVEKKALNRQSLIEDQISKDLKPGSGNLWKRGVTLPQQFKLTKIEKNLNETNQTKLDNNKIDVFNNVYFIFRSM